MSAPGSEDRSEVGGSGAPAVVGAAARPEGTSDSEDIAWRRCSGLVSTASPHAARAEAFLDGAQVIALIESDPEAPYAVAVTIAVDSEDRVAVLAAGESQIVPGPPLAELAEALATECQALVVFGEVIAEDVGEAQEHDGDPFAFEIDPESARLPERAVVLTGASPRDLETLATDAQTTLYVIEHGEARLAFLAEGPALTSLEWREAHFPVLLLEQGESFPSVTVMSDSGEAHLYSWDVTLTVVPGAGAEVVHPFVMEELGSGALLRRLMQAWPDSDAQRLLLSLEESGKEGLPHLALALGLPDIAAAFLRGDVEAADVPDAIELDPMTIGEQVRRAMDDVADEARAQVEHMRSTAGEYREQARSQLRELGDEAREQARANVEQARRHASEASAAMQSFADPDEHPTLAWTTPVAGVAQGVGAIIALRKALGHAQNGGSGTKWWGLLAGVLGAAAAGNLALTALPWVKRLRARLSGATH